MADDWFGHRDTLTGMPSGDRDEWIDWDHRLASAFQTIEAYTDSHGLYRWQVDDEAVFVDAVAKISKFEESKELASRGQKNPPAGQYFVPEVKTRRSNGHIQTFQEYRAAEREKALAELAEKSEGA